MGIAPDIGGRGGGGAVVRGPFAFAYNTPGLTNGIEVWTPAAGEILLDAWFDVTTVFNGTTPFADIGVFVNSTSGLFASTNMGRAHLNFADDKTENAYEIGAQPVSLQDAQGGGAKVVPLVFKTATPMLLVVSQTGIKGGLAIGGTTGAANLYIVTCSSVNSL